MKANRNLWSEEEKNILRKCLIESETNYEGCKKASKLLGRSEAACLSKWNMSETQSSKGSMKEHRRKYFTQKAKRESASQSIFSTGNIKEDVVSPIIEGNVFEFEIKSYRIKNNRLIITV